jgi:ADP-ribose pyrophosphatase YjhB (NUDIX family)
MKRQKRKYCQYCSDQVEQRVESDTLRDYCPSCAIYFYENPLPVVSTILVNDRKVLLVKRGNDPYRGQWCLPSGFAESGESIAAAALRELEEETGIQGRIVHLQDVDSSTNYYYGDLLFLTFEVEQIGGEPKAGDDAVDVQYFSLERIPDLAFPSNTKALQSYVEDKKDYWAIVDSFSLAAEDKPLNEMKKKLLSDKLVELIEEHSEHIAKLWVEDVRSNRSTPTFHDFDQDALYRRVFLVISHFGQWLKGSYNGQDIITYYTCLGKERRSEGFCLSEVVSALSLTKKHIWEFALSKETWSRTIDIYMVLEFARRISIFFDRAVYYVAKGYDE